MNEHKHEFRQFRIQSTDQKEWPVRECKKCHLRQVLSADGWVNDDWANWPYPVKETK